MVTTWEKPVLITPKNMIKKSKQTDTKGIKTHRKDSRIRNEEQGINKTARRQLTNCNSKSLPTNNYFKHKWINSSNQDRMAEWIKKKKRSNDTLSTRDSF